tara:strand:+ start:341 stop:580 length:240 start_codon:yes stop_codon:yes gene_type:complete
MNKKNLKDMNEEELKEHEHELAEFCLENATDYINNTLSEEHLVKLKEINFDFWHWVSLCLQERRVSYPDVIKKMLGYIE